MIRLKNPEQMARIRESCQMLARLFQELPAQAVEGRSTLDLDRWAEDWIHRHHGKPAFKGYQGYTGCSGRGPKDFGDERHTGRRTGA